MALLNLVLFKTSVFSVFQESIVPKIYENIELKVSGSESDIEKVSEFMNRIKQRQIVELFVVRPEER